MVIVGDSLSVGTAPFVHARTYAAEGRTMHEGMRIVRSLGHVHILVIGLGSNDHPLTLDPRPFVRQAARHADCVRWVGVSRRGYSYRAFNAALPQTHVPWHRAVLRHPEWLASDGLHCTVSGYRGRARLIRRAVATC